MPPDSSVPELSIIVPCYNERANVRPLVARLDAALRGIAWEAIFVDDDSPDGTAAEVRAVAATDPRVRCIRRIGRRGLSSAVVEGALSSSAAYVAVIDGDLQHDETRLPDLLAAVRAGADIAVGSRHVPGGDAAGLAGAWRHRISAAGTRLAQRALPVPLQDPMSGYFLLPRPLFEQIGPPADRAGLQDPARPGPVRPQAAARDGDRLPVPPARRGPQQAGRAGADPVRRPAAGQGDAGLLPLRFVSFALVGAVGVAVHLAVLTGRAGGGATFEVAQVAATLVAMLANFQLNNMVTYRDARLRGPALRRGLLLFLLGCGLGAYANIGIARVLYSDHAGWTPAGLAGAAIGLVWNYAVSATLVWRAR